MAITWRSGYLRSFIWLIDLSYLDSGDASQTLRFCSRFGAGATGWWDLTNSVQYKGVLDNFSVKEQTPWLKDLARGRYGPPVLRFGLSLPRIKEGSEQDRLEDNTLWTELVTGRFFNRAVVLTCVEVDANGIETAREEVFRGVCSTRGPDAWTMEFDKRPTLRWAAEGYGGAFTKVIPMDTWAVVATASTDEYGGDFTNEGAYQKIVYGLGVNVDTAGKDGRIWHELIVLDSYSASGGGDLKFGVCGHDIDENPISTTGDWLTNDGGNWSGMRSTNEDNTPDVFTVAAYPHVATYPKLETTYSSESASAFVAGFNPNGLGQLGKRSWAKTHGVGSEAGPSSSLQDVEDCLEDLIGDKCGVSNFWFTGWPAALPDTVASAARRLGTCVPGVELSRRMPKLGEVAGEWCGFFGLGIVQLPDSGNSNELRAKLFWRTVASAATSADTIFRWRDGLVRHWGVKTQWQKIANSSTIYSQDRFNPITSTDTGEIRLDPYTYRAKNATAQTDDGSVAVKREISYSWLALDTQANWSTQAAILLNHLAQRSHFVTAKLGYHGLAVRLGDTVQWSSFPSASDLEGTTGELGQCWARAIAYKASGDIEVTLTTAHGDFSYS